MKVTVFGSGYVGLVTGACLADAGNQVVCVDVDENKIALLRDAMQSGVPLADIEVMPPTLDEIYAHFLAAQEAIR